MDMEKYLKDLLRSQVEESNIQQMMKGVLRDLVRKEALTDFNAIIRTEVEAMVKETIHDLMINGSIETNDGFGVKLKFPNFETLFKTKLASLLKDSYKMERLIKQVIERKVSDLYGGEARGIKDAIIAQVSKTFEEKNPK